VRSRSQSSRADAKILVIRILGDLHVAEFAQRATARPSAGSGFRNPQPRNEHHVPRMGTQDAPGLPQDVRSVMGSK